MTNLIKRLVDAFTHSFEAGDYYSIRSKYKYEIKNAILEYLISESGSVAQPKNQMKQAMVEAFGNAFDSGYVDGGGDIKEMNDSDKIWIANKQQAEFGFIDQLFERLKELKKDSEVLKIYDILLEKDTNNAKMWFEKGLILSGLGKESDALSAYEKVLFIDPGHAGALARKGLIIGTRRQYAESFDLLERSIKSDPLNWNAWYGKGKVWGLKGNDLTSIDRKYDAMKTFENALNAYGKAIELNPKDAVLWFEEGVVLNKLGKANEALKAFDKSIEINPDSTGAWYEKGLITKELGNEADAVNCFKKVMELDPSHTLARHKLKH